MKLSNKILLGFFGSVILYTLLAAGEIRLNGSLRSENNEGFLLKSTEVSSFKHLVINDSDINISVNQSDTNRIEVRGNNENTSFKVPYRFSGDSLIIDSIRQNVTGELMISIYLNNRLQSINSNSTRTYIRNFNCDSLTVVASDNYLSFRDENEIQYLRLISKKGANVYLFTELVKTLDVQIDEATVTVRKELPDISAELVNGAVLSTKAPDNLRLKKERACKVLMYR